MGFCGWNAFSSFLRPWEMLVPVAKPRIFCRKTTYQVLANCFCGKFSGGWMPLTRIAALQLIIFGRNWDSAKCQWNQREMGAAPHTKQWKSFTCTLRAVAFPSQNQVDTSFCSCLQPLVTPELAIPSPSGVTGVLCQYFRRETYLRWKKTLPAKENGSSSTWVLTVWINSPEVLPRSPLYFKKAHPASSFPKHPASLETPSFKKSFVWNYFQSTGEGKASLLWANRWEL